MEKIDKKINGSYHLAEPPYKEAERQRKRISYFTKTAYFLAAFWIIAWGAYNLTKFDVSPSLKQLNSAIDTLEWAKGEFAYFERDSVELEFNEAGELVPRKQLFNP